VAAWPEARLQIVCGCRQRVDLAPPLVREATAPDRELAEDIFRREFGGRQLVADGQPITTEQADLLVAETEGGVAGALAWRRLPDALHIIALATDPMWQRAGVGSYLLAEAELLARRLTLPRVIVTLSNDNIPAQYFYQRRGYRLTKVLSGAIAAHPRNTGLVGFADIPIEDELQLSKELQG
jgi:ribosomal protein S18 acetylase RimI-like enzyme